MTSKKDKLVLLAEYYPQVAKFKYLATQAFGSRATESTEHEASREYTRLLKEYSDKGGSLLKMAEALEVTYPSLRRRVMTAEIAPLKRHRKSRASTADYQWAAEYLEDAKLKGTEQYHDAIYEVYKQDISLNKLAPYVGLKAAYPLYYGLNKARMRAGEID